MASVRTATTEVLVMLDQKIIQAFKRAILRWFAERGDVEGNPYDCFANHVGIGERTFKRRLKGEEGWADWELVVSCQALKDEELRDLLKSRYDWEKK